MKQNIDRHVETCRSNRRALQLSRQKPSEFLKYWRLFIQFQSSLCANVSDRATMFDIMVLALSFVTCELCYVSRINCRQQAQTITLD